MKTLRAAIISTSLIITQVVAIGQVRPNGTYNPGNVPVVPSVSVPQITRPTVMLPNPVVIPVVPTLGEFYQPNSLATTNPVPVWRPAPYIPAQPQTLIANQLRRPPILSPPPLMTISNLNNAVTNQATAALPPSPAPASTNTPVRLSPWQNQNPLLRDIKYHW